VGFDPEEDGFPPWMIAMVVAVAAVVGVLLILGALALIWNFFRA